MIVAFGDQQAKVVFAVGKVAMPSGVDLKGVTDQVVIAMNPAQVILGRSRVVDGVTAYETVFTMQDAQVIFVGLAKNGMMYSLFGYAPPEGFDTAQAGFDTAINSFKVQ